MRGWRVRRTIASVAGTTAVVTIMGTAAVPGIARAAVTGVAITSPVDNAVVEGQLPVTVHADVDPSDGDNAVSVGLVVDSVPVASGDQPCQFSTSCDATFSVDTTQWAPGSQHTLTPYVNDTMNPPTFGSAITATKASTPPSVVVSTPAPGATVAGQVTVAADASIDPSVSDSTASMQLLLNGQPVSGALQSCAAGSTCSASFTPDLSPAANGDYTLGVRLTTTDGVTADDTKTVHVDNDPALSITAPATGEGVVPVVAQASVPPGSTDTLTSLALNPGGSSFDCGHSANCSATLNWDASGVSGNQTVTVIANTADNHPVSQSAVVAVTTAPTTVSLIPAAGSTVTGVQTISATGTVGGHQTDRPLLLSIFVNHHDVLDHACDHGIKTCTASYAWDASGLNGDQSLSAVFQTSRKTVATTNVVHATTAPPTAAVTAPVSGGTVSGVVTVAASGTINAQQNDTPSTLQLLVDGAAVSAPQSCTGHTTGKTCALPYTWDTTGMSGAHTLQSKLVTTKGFTAVSPISTVTVVSPAPKVTITSPAGGFVVHRATTVTVTGVVDPSQNDTPSSMRLTVDGAPLGNTVPCPAAAGSRSCTATFSWSAANLLGAHQLVATLVTTRGASGTSDGTTVYVYGTTRTSVSGVKTQHAGHAVTVTGRVVAVVGKAGLAGVKVKVQWRPASGKAKTVYVHTNAKGYFSVKAKPAVNTTVVATVVPPSYLAVSHASTVVHVLPTASCVIGATVRRNVVDNGSCRLPRLPKGTRVTLEYSNGRKWFVLGRGKAPGATIPFSFRFAVRGTYKVRLVISATKVFAATSSPALKVVVT